MQDQNKVIKRKSNLSINIEQFPRYNSNYKKNNDGSISIKPLLSVKESNQNKQFKFTHSYSNQFKKTNKKKRIKKLKLEQEQLIRSIQILKYGAISAIAQKTDEIEKLKNLDIDQEQKLSFYEEQLQKSETICRELQNERENLYDEMRIERQRFVEQLQEREQLIETLYDEIQYIRKELNNLESQDEMKTKKIRCLEEQNHHLSQELQTSTLTQYLHSKQWERNNFNLEFDEATIKINGNHSIASSIPMKSNPSNESIEHIFQNFTDQTYYQQKIEQMQKSYRDQICSLTYMYEKKIKHLRDIYSKQFMIPTESNEEDLSQAALKKQYSHKSLSKNSQTQLRLRMKTQEQSYDQQEECEIVQQISKSKSKNLKLQIKLERLSDCPSFNHRIDDNESQFTTKYFENPFRFMKKNKSYESFKTYKTNVIQEEDHEALKTARFEKQDNVRNQEILKTESNWKQTAVFAAGLFSGVTVASLIGFLIVKFDRR